MEPSISYIWIHSSVFGVFLGCTHVHVAGTGILVSVIDIYSCMVAVFF